MIIQYGYRANGFKPARVQGLGFALLVLAADSQAIPGPFRSVAGQSWQAGSEVAQYKQPGSTAAQNHQAGSTGGQYT